MILRKQSFIFLIIVSIALLLNRCNNPETNNKTAKRQVYLNHSDTVKYVGMQKCLQCHADKATFLETGMGKSFDVASMQKSSGNFNRHKEIYDSYKNLHYQPFWSAGGMYLKEYRLNKEDTVHLRIEKCDYIIGSGQHTNSHMMNINGYLYQMPFTFYTQKQKLDLPPGYENGFNSRFGREIGLECMSCHNGYPQFEKGSENKYSYVPNGIDCERCHGPGQAHINQFMEGRRVDTASAIDYSIVNPAKLPIDLQFDVCQRCHLQGNAVLKEDKSFYDFKPGMKLTDVMSVFLPKYKNGDDDFIMASHSDRLKMSKCFISSLNKSANVNSLKPYKNALTCVTCHNPHISVRKTDTEIFNKACLNCHKAFKHKEKDIVWMMKEKKTTSTNCTACHMPQSGSIDIPHVSVHDHYIHKPIKESEKEKLKTFIGLKSINNLNPDNSTVAKAYLNQFEKFNQNQIYLDSALERLSQKSIAEIQVNINELVRAYFLKQDYRKVVQLAEMIGEDKLLAKLLTKIGYDNYHAWTAYRIGESYSKLGQLNKTLLFYYKATQLARYQLSFRNELATALFKSGKIAEAKKEFQFVINEQPKNGTAQTNIGYINLMEGNNDLAYTHLSQAYKLEPDNEVVVSNMIAYYLQIQDASNALKFTKELLRVNPKSDKGKELYKKLSN